MFKKIDHKPFSFFEGGGGGGHIVVTQKLHLLYAY